MNDEYVEVRLKKKAMKRSERRKKKVFVDKMNRKIERQWLKQKREKEINEADVTKQQHLIMLPSDQVIYEVERTKDFKQR